MAIAFGRRVFLAGLTGAAMTASTSLAARRPAAKGFFARTGHRIGLQLYTLGEEPAKDLDGTLAKVAAIGYRDLELPNLLGKTPQELKVAAQRAGVSFSNIHLAATPFFTGGGLNLTSPNQQIVDALGTLGIKSAVLPIMVLPENFGMQTGDTFQTAIARSLKEAGEDIWKRTAALLNEKAAALKSAGITLGYHNHNVEFAPVGKTNGWDIILGETDPGLVKLEIDLGWISAAGLDPAEFLMRHKGRVRWVHVKDVKPGTVTNYSLGMTPSVVGEGRIDWPRVLRAAQAAGVQHYYLEQEPPFEIPRIEAARKGYGFLAGVK